MDEFHDLDDVATEGLKADLIKLTQLLESEIDEIEQLEAAEDSLNEGEEERYQLNAVVGSDDEYPNFGQQRRSRELPAGIPLELIEEDRRAREQRRRPGRQRFSGIGRDDGVSSEDEASATPYHRGAAKEDGARQTLTGRRLKRKRSDRGSVSPRDPGADGHEVEVEVEADEEDAESVETPPEEVEEEDVGEEHTKEHVSAAEDSCESPSREDDNVHDAMEGDDEKTASDASVDAGRDDRKLIAVKVEDFYDDEAERGDDYEEEFARAPKRKRPAKDTAGRKGSKKMKKQRRSFEDRREAWDQLWEEKFQELVRWKEEKGVCAVGKSDNNKTLAWWIHEQRRKMRHGTLTEYRRARLESIGFVWSSDLDGRAGRRRRYLDPMPKEEHSGDAISVVHLAPTNPHELAMATMMTTIMKRPSNGDGRATRGQSTRGGRAKASTAKAEKEKGDEDQMEDEEEPAPLRTRMQLRSTSPRTLPEPEGSLPVQEEPQEDSFPTLLARQSVPLPRFYDIFLKREEERKRDKEAMEAMLARLQEERDNDKERISRLEEVVRQLSENAIATSTHAVANNGKNTSGCKIEVTAPDDEGSAEAASPTGIGDLSAEQNDVPAPPPYPPSPATNAGSATLAPASLQTPINLGVVEAVAWKREQLQQQQREKIRKREREQAKARGMHQLLEDGKILANVEEIEIEQFFV